MIKYDIYGPIETLQRKPSPDFSHLEEDIKNDSPELRTAIKSAIVKRYGNFDNILLSKGSIRIGERIIVLNYKGVSTECTIRLIFNYINRILRAKVDEKSNVNVIENNEGNFTQIWGKLRLAEIDNNDCGSPQYSNILVKHLARDFLDKNKIHVLGALVELLQREYGDSDINNFVPFRGKAVELCIKVPGFSTLVVEKPIVHIIENIMHGMKIRKKELFETMNSLSDQILEFSRIGYTIKIMPKNTIAVKDTIPAKEATVPAKENTVPAKEDIRDKDILFDKYGKIFSDIHDYYLSNGKIISQDLYDQLKVVLREISIAITINFELTSFQKNSVESILSNYNAMDLNWFIKVYGEKKLKFGKNFILEDIHKIIDYARNNRKQFKVHIVDKFELKSGTKTITKPTIKSILEYIRKNLNNPHKVCIDNAHVYTINSLIDGYINNDKLLSAAMYRDPCFIISDIDAIINPILPIKGKGNRLN